MKNMESLRYTNLLQKAQKNELTANDLSEMFIVLDAKTKVMKSDITRSLRSIRDIEEEYPILPPEADDLSKAVRKRGVEVMGGKKSGAYQNTDIRKRVYRDIYNEVKRQYGLVNDNGTYMSYKKLKRKYFKGALDVVANYDVPILLQNEIMDENELAEFEE